MKPTLFASWFWAFAWTLAIELPIYAAILRRWTGAGPALLAIAIGVNVATHPALWFLMPRFTPYMLWLIVAESLVVLVEAGLVALWLHRRGVGGAGWRGLLVAATANTVSTVVGLLLLYRRSS